MKKILVRRASAWGGVAFLALQSTLALAALPVPVGTLDPTTIPQFVTPLVIPPEMPKSTSQPGTPAAQYNIAVRQFKQQILPGGIWNTLNGRNDAFGPTTVWSYGRAQDPPPDSSGIVGGAVGVAPATNSSFNYPAFTVENTSGTRTTVRWINGLVDTGGRYLPHLFAVDQTLHWANPPKTGCVGANPTRTDCMTMNPAPYTGPVPMVTHVHGAHVNPESDGYPEAWWLPAANNIPAGYAKRGSDFDQFNTNNAVPGSAYFGYENAQPATTLWYHDHALGMTRLNVYAGPAGFWIVRGGAQGDANVTDNNGAVAVLPGHRPTTMNIGDPNFNPAVRATIREIPIAIQDRTFKTNGDLFYPDNRAFFEGLNQPPPVPPQLPGMGVLQIPFIGDPNLPSDIAPIWNPEAFFNTIVANGTTWPVLDVAPALYRFRLLNGCNSRFLNLSLIALDATGGVLGEVPFYLLGAEQGYYPQVVRIVTGQALPLIPGAAEPPLPAYDPLNPPIPGNAAALAMGPATRSDVLVDFSKLPANTVRVQMRNDGPDVPFGGFPILPADVANTTTTGRVMEFAINPLLLNGSDALVTAPSNLVLPFEGYLTTPIANTRQVSLNEEVSAVLCVNVSLIDGTVTVVPNSTPPACAGGGLPFGPKAALLGTVDTVNGISTPLRWMDAITEKPIIGDTEVWEIYNMTMDAHPIHIHLVRFEVVNRQNLQVNPITMEPLPVVDSNSPVVLPDAWDSGYRDTVTALPGQVTRIKARFDIAGLYVWHCHIVEHEDNEMMRPYVVRFDPNFPDINRDGVVNRTDLNLIQAEIRSIGPKNPAYDLNGDGKVDLLDARLLSTKIIL